MRLDTFARRLAVSLAVLLALPAFSSAEVYELRTYTTHEGKLESLHARFRDHTMALFAKQGIINFPPQRAVVSYLGLKNPDLPKFSAYLLSPGQPTPGMISLLRLSIAVSTGTGILTCFPSTTPLGLALGAD